MLNYIPVIQFYIKLIKAIINTVFYMQLKKTNTLLSLTIKKWQFIEFLEFMLYDIYGGSACM